jgi:hypothetical protein
MAARSEEAYEVRIKEAGKGVTRRCDVRHDTMAANKLVGAEGAALLDKATRTVQHSVYKETVLERAEGAARPASLRREYEKAVVQQGDEKPQALPYQDKTVVIERGESGYRFAVDGGPLEGADARLLDKEFNAGDFDLQRHVLPRKAVRVGDTWALDMAALARDWERNTLMQADAAKAKGTGKLVKVYDQGGRTFGVMEFRLELPVVSVGDDRKQIKMEDGSRMVMEATLEACIDGRSATGTLRAGFLLEGEATIMGPDGQPARLTVSTRGGIQESREEVEAR